MTQKCYKDGKLHRDDDLPAVVYSNGTSEWYKNGLLHRDGDLPAIIWASGTKEWYKNGLLHRDCDFPAIIYSCGARMWYKNGLLHREDNKPAVIWSEDLQEWFVNNKRHRNNGPAYIDKHSVFWYNNDKIIKQTTRKSYDELLLKMFCAVQLYRKTSAKKDSIFYRKWNKSKILEPLLTGMIVRYM